MNRWVMHKSHCKQCNISNANKCDFSNADKCDFSSAYLPCYVQTDMYGICTKFLFFMFPPSFGSYKNLNINLRHPRFSLQTCHIIQELEKKHNGYVWPGFGRQKKNCRNIIVYLQSLAKGRGWI